MSYADSLGLDVVLDARSVKLEKPNRVRSEPGRCLVKRAEL